MPFGHAFHNRRVWSGGGDDLDSDPVGWETVAGVHGDVLDGGAGLPHVFMQDVFSGGGRAGHVRRRPEGPCHRQERSWIPGLPM